MLMELKFLAVVPHDSTTAALSSRLVVVMRLSGWLHSIQVVELISTEVYTAV
jgi:hypothetical protein